MSRSSLSDTFISSNKRYDSESYPVLQSHHLPIRSHLPLYVYFWPQVLFQSLVISRLHYSILLLAGLPLQAICLIQLIQMYNMCSTFPSFPTLLSWYTFTSLAYFLSTLSSRKEKIDHRSPKVKQ